MTTEDLLDELQLVDDNDFDEPMIPGSNEFSDCELEDEDLHDTVVTTQLLHLQLSRQVVHQPFLLNGLST